MSEQKPTLTADYFEGIYEKSADPWGFETSSYEREKYAATLAMLQKPLYRSALEVGCSIGVFTTLLAPQCGKLLAIDGSAIALSRATQRPQCSDVIFEQRTVPSQFPFGHFDLMILSEVLYYLSASDLVDMAARCLNALNSGGEIILCHWLGETDYPLSGEHASDLFAKAVSPRLPQHKIANDKIYRLERFSA
jgi:SAM-dependent methyltransferase